MYGVLASAAIDAGLVSELITLVKSCMTLFTEFPINIVLISSLFGIAVFCKYFLEKVAGIFPDVASGNSLKLQRPDLMHFSIKSDIADID